MSDFWARKIRTFFRQFDFDKDGAITKKDFDLMAISFHDKENKGDESTKEKGRKATAEFYDSLTKAAKAGSGKVMTEDVLIDSLKSQRNDPELKKNIADVARSLFEVLDTNKDGFIQFEEYRRTFSNLGLPDVSFTKKAFDTIDSDHDGKLNFAEILNALSEFFFSEDEKNPFSFTFGPLV